MRTRISVVAISLFLINVAIAQVEKKLESQITHVTVFLNKAQVTREARGKLEPGKTDLIITGLTAQLDPGSIQVAGKGNFIVLGIVHRQNFLNEVNMPKSLKSMKDSVDYLQRQTSLEQSQKEILGKEEQMLLSNQKIGGMNQNLTVTELKAMADFYRSRLSEIVNTRMKLDEKIIKINERITKLQNQINDQNELYSRNTSEIVISVSAEASVSAELEINYVVANAGWYPLYDIRAINTKKPLQLNYKANVYQSTGEEWRNVKIKLSTANPDLGGLKPELDTWYLDFYQPVYKSLAGRAAGVFMDKSPKPEMSKEDVSSEIAADPAKTIVDYVQTIQTTLNTEFDISLPYTISSSSKPVVVDIRNYEMKADYSYSVAPKLDLDAFLLAKATGWEEFSLLPGEANIFFEGTYVGKTFIDPNNIKDTLSLSLGRDKRIVVKREKMKDLTSRKLIGFNQKENYTYEISVRNTKSEMIKITVEDQIPVSQNTQIEVSVLNTGEANYNKTTGKLVWRFAIQQNETKKTVFGYEVKYPKDQQIAGL